MYTKNRCIVIKSIDFKDADKLVTVFSEKEGKLRAVAKGIKKPNSSLRACVQPFAHSFLFFSPSGELGLITQGKVLDFYGHIRDNINLSLATVYLMELLDKSLMENVPYPRLYQSTLEVLNTLNNPELPYNPLILRYFEMLLLIELGYKPVLDKCVVCQNPTKESSISISEGGLVCANCAKHSQNTILVMGETLAILKLLANANLNTLLRVKCSAKALEQIELVLERYLEYYLERKLKVKDTIKRLKLRLAIPN